MYVAPPARGRGRQPPRVQNFDVNRKALSLYPFVASFKEISKKSDFMQIFFHDFFFFFFFLLLSLFLSSSVQIQYKYNIYYIAIFFLSHPLHPSSTALLLFSFFLTKNVIFTE